MKHLYRDGVRSLLTVLLIACAAAIAGLGAAVYLFTAQQTRAVEDSSITLAVRHVGSLASKSYDVQKDAKMLEILNAHESVKVPALIRAFAGINASVTPVYSGDVALYNWSRDREIAHAVMTVTCLEDLGPVEGASTWQYLVQVDEMHLALPYDVPDVIRVERIAAGSRAQEPLIPGESYLLCGRYEDYVMNLDISASMTQGYYDPVYVPDKSEPPLLRLADWWDLHDYMKYIAAPDDTQWLAEAVRMGGMNNRMLHLNCINDLNRLRWFQNGTAAIVEGRSFTQAEQDSGAQVCIISRELAEVNGLHVGDTITMNANQPSIGLTIWSGRYNDTLSEYYAFVNVVDLPADDFYDFRGVDVTLEIVGIYAAPLYTNTIDEFTPNTVFAPYHAVDFAFHELLLRRLPIHTQNLILHNGQGEAFLQAVRDAGYPDGLYTIEETNYAAVEEILSLMRADSRTLLLACTGVGGLLYLLILYLYGRSWRRENAILSMLGTTRMRIALRMFAALAVLVLLGCGAALAGVTCAKSLIEDALNSVYIASSMDFSAIRVGAFSETGMTLAPGTIAAAVGLTAGAFLLMAALLSIYAARKKANTCLFD